MTPRSPSDGELLSFHLQNWLGAWPPRAAVDVVSSPRRDEPAWDGRISPLVGVGCPGHVVLSVSPQRAEAVRRVVGPLDDLVVQHAVVDALGAVGSVLGRGVFRWSTAVTGADVLPDVGEWVDADDPRIPRWLRPFNYGPVLVVWDAFGNYGAGVGIKRHDAVGHEIAVVTEERFRGRGLAKRLVAQAARRVLREGGLPTYLHGPDNAPSARIADAVGFADHGWSVYGLFGPDVNAG